MAKPTAAPPVENVATPQPVTAHEPTRAEIEARAYYRYVERGCVDGCDVEDWLTAEDELRHNIEVRAA